MDSPNPLLWDLLWFAVFGIVPLVAGVLLGRAHNRREAQHSGHAAAAALALAVIVSDG